MQFGSDPALGSRGGRGRPKSRLQETPLVKLSPLVTDIGLIARPPRKAGADALTVANTYPAMAIDFRTGKSRLGNKTGGLSGPALNPYFEAWFWETA